VHGILHKLLGPIRTRQRWLSILRVCVVGLVVSAALAFVLGLGRFLAGWSISPWAIGLLLVAGVLPGLIVGLLRRRDWSEAAVAVDRHYDLKDRTLTALEFVAQPRKTVLHELQVDDTVQFLADVEPRRVVPLRVPRVFPVSAAVLLAAAFFLVLWPGASPTVGAKPPDAPPELLAEAEEIEADLQELEDVARREGNEDLARLVQALREKVQEMKQPGVELRDVLAKLSEMQAQLAAQQAEYNVALVDEELKSLGSAMTPAQALENVGKALEEAKFDKAAELLDKLDEPPADRKEAKAVEEKLNQAAAKLQEKGLGKLSQATSDMAKGVKGDKGKMQKGSRDLARQTREHQRRRRMQQLLALEMDRLKDCKSRCSSSMLSWLDRQKKKQSEPNSGAGKSPGGKLLGEKNKMSALRDRKELIGKAGEGPSEVETSHSPEGQQQAGRLTRDRYQKYRRLSEAVLDSEPIPLGQRQTIRRYFELIRPSQTEGEGPRASDRPR
jgi:hypothetical protein